MYTYPNFFGCRYRFCCYSALLCVFVGLLLQAFWQPPQAQAQQAQPHLAQHHHQRNNRIIMTGLYSDAYFDLALTLAHSARKHHPDVPFAIQYIPKQVSEKNLDAFSALGYQLVPAEKIIPKKLPWKAEWKDTYTKFHFWNYTQYHRVVYIDADCLIVGNISGLLDLPRSLPFAVVNDVEERKENPYLDTFNSGVMSIAPNTTVMHDLLDVMMHPEGKYDTDHTEQACLNYYYQHKATTVSLIYNLMLSLWRSSNNPELRKTWDALLPDARVIHYTIAKPLVHKTDATFEKDHKAWFEEHAEARKQLDSVLAAGKQNSKTRSLLL